MRSTVFYPRDNTEGIFIYKGDGNSFIDQGLRNGLTYYYTAFSYDKAGNYSSGALVSAVPRSGVIVKPPEEIESEEECLEAGYYWYDQACHREEKGVEEYKTEEECLEAGYYWYDQLCHEEPQPIPEIEELTLEDFDFIQEEEKLPIEEGDKIRVKIEKILTVAIDYDKVPEVLKTIMVTLEKDGKSFSFLLRVNSEKSRYEAFIAPFHGEGIADLTITILDYKNQVLKKIPGQLILERSEPLPSEPSWYDRYKFFFYLILIVILLLIFLILIIYFIWKLRFRDDEEENLKEE